MHGHTNIIEEGSFYYQNEFGTEKENSNMLHLERLYVVLKLGRFGQ
jgi:hypothetical protein